MFSCDKCGCCCRNLDKSELYIKLNRGDGVCRYLEGNLCSIYDRRPDICNVEKGYKMFFEKLMSIEEYYYLNEYACKILKELEEE